PPPCIYVSRPPPSSTLFPYTTLFRSRPSQQRARRPAPTPVRAAAGPAGRRSGREAGGSWATPRGHAEHARVLTDRAIGVAIDARSEEHTSELQSRFDLVCRLLLEKKK